MLLLLAGCVSIKPSHIARDPSPVMRHPSYLTKYTPPGASQLYKATLDIKKHHLTGLLVVKRMEESSGRENALPHPIAGSAECSGTYRVVFMNEVGMTFFDLEMDSCGLKVISCFESLNKKALMKIFETDLRTLLCGSSLEKEQMYRQSGTNCLVISGLNGNCRTWQSWSPMGDTLHAISAKSTIADPVLIRFANFSNGFPMKIILENPFINLKLSLRKLAN